jgi:glycosyltransferase involved in cell wall biosynthesis
MVLKKNNLEKIKKNIRQNKFLREKNPLVSVLMPNYNNEKYISETIESILNQTYNNFEFIIVDDCSSDRSWKIIQKYANKNKKIRAYKNEKNEGRPKTRNKLLSLISKQADYFLWIDSDDIVKDNIIEKKINYLNKNKEIDVLGSNIEYVTEELKHIKDRIYPKKFNQIKEIFLLYSPLSQGGLMLKSNLKNQKYNLNYKVCQDYELWTRLIDKNYVFENLQETFYLYRQTPNQGKQKHLKLTIWNTIKIKSKYIFKWKYFRFKFFFRYCGEIIMLFFPNKMVLWIFYKMMK